MTDDDELAIIYQDSGHTYVFWFKEQTRSKLLGHLGRMAWRDDLEFNATDAARVAHAIVNWEQHEQKFTEGTSDGRHESRRRW